MWEDLRLAAREGIVLGVKWGVAAVLIVLAVSWLLGDYTQVRQRAFNGQQAFEFLQQRQAQAAQEGAGNGQAVPVTPGTP